MRDAFVGKVFNRLVYGEIDCCFRCIICEKRVAVFY